MSSHAASEEEDYVNIEESDAMLTNDDEHRGERVDGNDARNVWRFAWLMNDGSAYGWHLMFLVYDIQAYVLFRSCILSGTDILFFVS
jgi:hypothetical protein